MHKDKNVQVYLSVIILVISLFMSIGFAAAGNITLNINNTSLTKAPTEPFISSATLSSNVGANTSATNVTTGDNTFANFNVSLSPTNAYSSATYTVTLYNPTDKEYTFDNVLYELGSTTYSNENIVFDLSGISKDDIIFANSSKTFDITFHYKNNILPSVKTLNAILNFRVYTPNFLSKDWAVLAGFKSSYDAENSVTNVQSISFYSNGSIFNGNPIDVSKRQNNSILLYKVLDTRTNMYDVHISSNQKIDFPEDSNYLLAYYLNTSTINFNNSIDVSNATTMRGFLLGNENLISIDFNNFNTVKVTDMWEFFGSCLSLKTIDLTSFNMSNVESLANFLIGTSIKSIGPGSQYDVNISGWDTSNVEIMCGMFAYNAKFVTANLSNLNVSKVVDMSCMFMQTGIKSIGPGSQYDVNISGWDTLSLQSMENMLSHNDYIVTVDLGNFNTINVTSCKQLFAGCSSLSTVDLSNWNTSNLINILDMFAWSGVSKIYVGSGWTVSNVTTHDNVFLGCTNLVGGKGTRYSIDHINKEYARIDGAGGPGYFSNKNAGPFTINVLSNDTNKGTVSGSGTYNLVQNVTITATPKTNNSFLGWYENNELISRNTTINFYATKNRNIIGEFRTTRTLSLTNENSTYGSITGSGSYAENSEVTIIANENNGYIFNGWYDNDTLISKQRSYTFIMPNFDISYTARFESYNGPTWSIIKAPGAAFGFVKNSNYYYESNNKFEDNSAAVSILTINVPENNTTIDFYCINSGENYYDYGFIGLLDGTLTTDNTEDTNVSKSFKGLNLSTEQVFRFTGVSAGTHTIYIKFRKDESSNFYNDSLQFKVGFNGYAPVDAS